MNGLEDFIAQAMELINVDDDYLACCNKPRHRAIGLAKAMLAVAQRAHDEHSRYVENPVAVTTCSSFPCRITREFGDLTDATE